MTFNEMIWNSIIESVILDARYIDYDNTNKDLIVFKFISSEGNYYQWIFDKKQDTITFKTLLENGQLL